MKISYKSILPKKIYEKKGADLILALVKLTNIFFGILFVILAPFIYLGIFPASFNGIEYIGLQGVLIWAMITMVFCIVFPFIFYLTISYEKFKS